MNNKVGIVHTTASQARGCLLTVTEWLPRENQRILILLSIIIASSVPQP